jgi:hypothetical protein
LVLEVGRLVYIFESVVFVVKKWARISTAFCSNSSKGEEGGKDEDEEEDEGEEEERVVEVIGELLVAMRGIGDIGFEVEDEVWLRSIRIFWCAFCARSSAARSNRKARNILLYRP